MKHLLPKICAQPRLSFVLFNTAVSNHHESGILDKGYKEAFHHSTPVHANTQPPSHRPTPAVPLSGPPSAAASPATPPETPDLAYRQDRAEGCSARVWCRPVEDSHNIHAKSSVSPRGCICQHALSVQLCQRWVRGGRRG